MQGVKINDKHIEVMVRQMLQKVEITDSGDNLVVNRLTVKSSTKRTKGLKEGLKLAEGKPVLLGITKQLPDRSFISAASFQEQHVS